MQKLTKMLLEAMWDSVYSKLQDMGVTKDDAFKGLVSKLIEFVKRIIRMRNVKCAKCITYQIKVKMQMW